eukprot:TRINITY_DN1620_c0_g1_i1.p1 TRINITY_DN1620_c0_g1~~TRINITY_DN1620_c0_g1_i1.p1  ORF type:complete len:354 (+),score=77.15 TRINITY_DN1620_c0_g1_i1:70-1131(+)
MQRSLCISAKTFGSAKSASLFRRKFSSDGGGSVLLLAEHDNKKLGSVNWNLVEAAKQLKCKEINVLLAGHFEGNQSQDLAKQVSQIEGVTKVYVANKPDYAHGTSESLAALIKNCQTQYKNSYILGAASSFGKNVLPRVAGILGVSQVSDVTKIKSADTFMRPIYAGNALATVQSTDPIKILTVRPTSFDKAKDGNSGAEIVQIPDNLNAKFENTEWIKDEVKVSTRPDLGSARIVVSGGRGMKSAENFKILEQLADVLGGAVGASRAAVDAGYVSNDLQVGQTGKIVAPELYIAVGISGAIQHLAGMKDSKVIVAINKDTEAPIFQVADYGIVTDLFTAVPEMTNILKKAKQ